MSKRTSFLVRGAALTLFLAGMLTGVSVVAHSWVPAAIFGAESLWMLVIVWRLTKRTATSSITGGSE